jgi:hypothetical protein
MRMTRLKVDMDPLGVGGDDNDGDTGVGSNNSIPLPFQGKQGQTMTLNDGPTSPPIPHETTALA